MGAYLSISNSSITADENNYYITCKLYYHGNGKSYNSYTSQCKWTISLNGSSVTGHHSFTKSTGSQYLGTASFTVGRGTGYYTVTPTAKFVTGVSLGTMSKTGSAIGIAARNIYTVYTGASTGGFTNGNQAQYYGYAVTIAAYPSTGYSFSSWSDGGAQTHNVGVYGNAWYTAYFSVNYYTLTTSVNNSEYGSVTEGGSKAYGSTTTLTATPADIGYHFVNWNGTNTTNPLTVTMGAANATYIANFAKNAYTIRFHDNRESGGTEDTETLDQARYSHTEEALTPNTWSKKNYRFYGWTTTRTEWHSYKKEGEEPEEWKDYDDEQLVDFIKTENTIVHLYAVWIQTAYPIIYSKEGLDDSSPIPDEYDQIPGEKTIIEYSDNFTIEEQTGLYVQKTGYHIPTSPNKQWEGEDGSSYTGGQEIIFTAPDTLKAEMSPNAYKIKFNLNGGN